MDVRSKKIKDEQSITKARTLHGDLKGQKIFTQILHAVLE